jgi:ferrous iron transport protein A
MLEEGMAMPSSNGSQGSDGAAPERAGGFPLAMAREGDSLIIGSMHGSRNYRRQLMDMGLRPGGRIRVLRAGSRGPVLVLVGETRLGIGRGMAEKIEVVPAGKNEGDR